jgi:Tol biopolymer transport system component
MNTADRLERDLTAWFVQAADQRPLDYRDDILRLTAGTSQRSRLTSPERWLPMTVITAGRRTFPPFPWRSLGLLVALGIVLLGLAAYVASRPRLPAPFGLAANGLVAYAQNGDIFTVDPISGVRQGIATGPEDDHDPRFSLDGTRLAFLRSSRAGQSLVIVDMRDRNGGIVITPPLGDVDPDAVAWAPDGRTIAVGATARLRIVDTRDGTPRQLDVPYSHLDFYWRPPDGRELLFYGGIEGRAGLFAVRLDDGAVTEIVREGPGQAVRPNGWSPDGRLVVYTLWSDAAGEEVRVVDPATGDEVVIDAAFAHVSNSGTRILAISGRTGGMCIADIGGGPCAPIGTAAQAFTGTHAAGASWSPDDRWIISAAGNGPSPVLVDPDGRVGDQPSWLADGAQSWQRVAP